MPAFQFLALEADGRSQRGVLQADTARAARAVLRERGLSPLEVEPLRDSAAAIASGRRGPRLRAGESALFTRQLATLVASGLPIDESLQAVAEGAEGEARALVVALRARVMEGASLAAGMAEFPQAFSPLFQASVAAGESAGRLDTVLLRLADYDEQRDAMRRKVLLALTYPALLTLVALAVVLGLMTWVVPQVVGVFLQYERALPWATRVLIAVSDALRNYGAAAALALAALVAGGVLAWRAPGARQALHGALLRAPLLGRLLRAVETARFARTLALLAGSAVPLLEALGIAAQVVGNEALRAALGRVAARVREGQAFARALADTGEFSPVAVKLIASGERSGRLDAMLGEAAAQQERELDTALGVAMAALGPAVILAVGGLVLFIVLAILLPIFELNTLIR
jgi:general secretion pathway protein F